MPPESPRPRHTTRDAGQNTKGAPEPYYTNEDVAVLNDIVVRAQQLLPGLPERERLPTNALFGAYYDILPQIGVNADHDNRYARILFKIGGLRGQGTLFEKFEEILSRMGIEIEFDHEDQDEVYGQLEDSQTNLGAHATAATMPDGDEIDSPPDRRRRNSESSAWDLGDELDPKRGERRSSFSSAAKVNPFPTNNRRSPVGEGLAAKLQPPPETTDNTQNEGPDGHLGAWLDFKHGELRRGRGRSISTHASMRIRRQSPPMTTRHLNKSVRTSVAASDEYLPAAVVASHEQEVTTDPKHPAEYALSQTSDSLMQIKASLILHHHLAFLANRQFRHWRDLAVRLREDNGNLQLLARHRDKQVLLRQAVGTWLSQLKEKRVRAETDRFFAHLERRAVRARDLFLLHKAFSHWTESTVDAVQRTSIARRHILRTRIFNAWRDITAVNELKVRRQRLKLIFGVWRRKYIIISGSESSALQRFHGNLVQKIYRLWAQKFWHIEAAKWCDEGVKQRAVVLWRNTTQKLIYGHVASDEVFRLHLLRDTWRAWKAKSDRQAKCSQDADLFYHTQTCRSTLGKWHREKRVLPARKTVQTDVAVRLVRGTFEIWLRRSRQERQAATLYCMKIIREAWTDWLYKLRFQVFSVRVDDRVILEVLYKWVLAERLVLAKRLLDQRLLRGCLKGLVRCWTRSKVQRWDQGHFAKKFATQKTQKFVLGYWHSRLQFRQQLEAYGSDIHTRRLLHHVLLQWLHRTQHLWQLQQWSRDAEFYFLTTKILKQWRASTESVKRDKRRAAYAQVRRMVKMNLARCLLRDWQYQVRRVLELEGQASEKAHKRNVIIGMNAFDRWRARTEELEELELLWQEKLLRKNLLSWKRRLVVLQTLNEEAALNFAEHRQGRSLKKWNLQTLQLEALSRYSFEIREKHLKRSFRKIFTYWKQRAADNRSAKNVEQSERGQASSQLGTTVRAEEWSDFGDAFETDEWGQGLGETNISTTIPGYLSTPSKRTERVITAAARWSSTTPKAPLSTPFERHLRAQYSGGLLPRLRQGPGRSILNKGDGFPDIAKP